MADNTQINMEHTTPEGSAGGSPDPPGKRPRMLSKACEACKRKKSRCDSSRPRCDKCRRQGIACVYRERGQPGLRPGYGKAIENRLSLLESNFDKISESMQDVLSCLRSGIPPTAAPLRAVEPDGSAVNNVVEAMSQGSQSIASPVQRDILGDTSPQGSSIEPMSAATSGMEAPIWPGAQPLPGVTVYSTAPTNQNVPATATIDATLPPTDVMQELVELFFKMVYPWAPMFYKPSFTATMYSPERQLLLHGIVVVAFRFWMKPDLAPEVRDAYIKKSREQILLRTIDSCTLTSTQALALLAIDSLGLGQGPRTWNVMSMLVCAAKHLCLSRAASTTAVEANTPLVRNEDADDGLSMSSIEAEEKRRLFWVIYSIDRLSSASHGQPGGTDTKSIRLSYPVDEEDWGQALAPEWFHPAGHVKHSHRMNLWHHYIDLLALVDLSNSLLIQPVNHSIPAHCQEWKTNFRRLDIALSTWFENLSAEARCSPRSFDPMWFTVHATFHLIGIRMYTVAAFPSTTSPYLRASASARARCRQSVRDVASLASSLQPHELDQLGPMFAFVVWVAARSLIIIWTTGYEATYNSSPADLDPLLGTLRRMALRWPCAQRYVDLIQLILDTKNNPEGPTGLDVFNDTRRTAYGLQNRLGLLAGGQFPEFDFLDMPILDIGDLSTTWNGSFGTEADGEWF